MILRSLAPGVLLASHTAVRAGIFHRVALRIAVQSGPACSAHTHYFHITPVHGIALLGIHVHMRCDAPAPHFVTAPHLTQSKPLINARSSFQVLFVNHDPIRVRFTGAPDAESAYGDFAKPRSAVARHLEWVPQPSRLSKGAVFDIGFAVLRSLEVFPAAGQKSQLTRTKHRHESSLKARLSTVTPN